VRTDDRILLPVEDAAVRLDIGRTMLDELPRRFAGSA